MNDITLRNLAITRPLVALDLESTGTDPRLDRVVEIAAVRLAPSGSRIEFATLVNPGVPIPPGATSVHGLADADVAGAPPFAEIAAELAAFLSDCDLTGFGVASFDLPLLAAEFARAGAEFRLAGRAVVDALAVYRRHEPRDLEHAVGFYLGRGHADAHSAAADAVAALEVLDAQVGRYGLPPAPADLRAALGGVDVAGRFVLNPDGECAFNFGKYRGRRLSDVARDDAGYLRWMLGQTFLDDVRELIGHTLANSMN